jgi:hypothetical protein
MVMVFLPELYPALIDERQARFNATLSPQTLSPQFCR